MKKKIFLQVESIGYSFIKKQKKYFLDNFDIYFYVLVDKKKKKNKELIKKLESIYEEVIFCDFSKTISIFNAVKDIRKNIVGISTSSDENVKFLRKVVPFFPKLKNPTTSSLKWSSDKKWMREFWFDYDKDISPKFIEVISNSESQINKIEKKLEYPVMLKPTGMASSKLVSKNYHRDELEDNLDKLFRSSGIIAAFKDILSIGGEKKSVVIAEEFMEGKMYSIDGIIDDKGKITMYPPVYIKTGKEVGYDDFFGYMQLLPSRLSDTNLKNMNVVIKKAINALSLTNSHFHIELLKTDDYGWRIIEVAPRIGGFREFLYKNVYNFSVNRNNILNKIGQKVEFNSEKKGAAAVLKIYAKKEGKIKSILGTKKIIELESFVKIKKKKNIGDMARFAKNNGEPILLIYLNNEKRGSLLGDIRKIEQDLKIII